MKKNIKTKSTCLTLVWEHAQLNEGSQKKLLANLQANRSKYGTAYREINICGIACRWASSLGSEENLMIIIYAVFIHCTSI